MGKLAAILGVALLVGVAFVSYPTWSQWAQLREQEVFGQSNSTLIAETSSSPVNASSSVAETTENQSPPDYGVVTTTQSTTPSIPFGPSWVLQFLNIVNSSRTGPSLSPCPDLDAFATLRFQTMTTGTNWEITHYGYTQDEAKTFGDTPGTFAEDYFYPTATQEFTPQGFAQFVQTTAPGHWSDLTSPSYRYYGAYYGGSGPILLFRPGCGPTELGPGINQTQLYSGCSPQQISGTWLVVELASVCP